MKKEKRPRIPFNHSVRLRAHGIQEFLLTRHAVVQHARCAWVMPVYMSVKVNSGGGKDSIYTVTIDRLIDMLRHSRD